MNVADLVNWIELAKNLLETASKMWDSYSWITNFVPSNSRIWFVSAIFASVFYGVLYVSEKVFKFIVVALWIVFVAFVVIGITQV